MPERPGFAAGRLFLGPYPLAQNLCVLKRNDDRARLLQAAGQMTPQGRGGQPFAACLWTGPFSSLGQYLGYQATPRGQVPRCRQLPLVQRLWTRILHAVIRVLLWRCRAAQRHGTRLAASTHATENHACLRIMSHTGMASFGCWVLLHCGILGLSRPHGIALDSRGAWFSRPWRPLVGLPSLSWT